MCEQEHRSSGWVGDFLFWFIKDAAESVSEPTKTKIQYPAELLVFLKI